MVYPDGTVLQGLLLSHENDTLRATVAGEDDVRTFTRIAGSWISGEGKPVHIEFEWQGREPAAVPDEAECVCSHDLASLLISALRDGSSGDG